MGKTSLLDWLRVDMVVGVYGAAERAGGEGGDDLVGVHVARRAGAGLEDVDGELRIVLAGCDLEGGLLDRCGELGLDHPEVGR